MRCFVISLRRAIERRLRIAGQLDAAGIEYSFFEAVDPACDRVRYFHHCDEHSFVLNTGRSPQTGELGCFASHLMLWRTCRLLNEPLAILEDDADLEPGFPAALSFVAGQIHRLGFVRLQDSAKPARAHQVVASTRTHRLEYCRRYPHGSMAYAISPQAADAFIVASRVVDAPVDVFIKRFWRHGQALHTLRPAAVTAGQASRRTTIGGRVSAQTTVMLKWRRWLHKRRDAWHRAAFNRRQACTGSSPQPAAAGRLSFPVVASDD